MDAIEALQATVIFGGLPRSELARLATTLRRCHHPRGRVLWREGDAADGLHIAMRGQLQVFRVDEEGREVVISVWLPGTSDGEPALFSPGGTRLTDARAVTDSETLLFARGPLLTYLESQPLAMRGMLTRLSILARSQTSQLTQIAHHDIAARLSRALLDLASSCGKPIADGIQISVPLSQRTLAGLVAATRENVNRTLARFASQGLVRSDGGYLVILDRGRLRAYVEPAARAS